ncbi:alcohol dehydrogenase [Sphingomonas sp. Root50]|nr:MULTISPECIES: PQQ-dependent dehydrogenase, methanol/ethanol family [unclassified Sphingomonas]KQX18654.1 alcohol dehydrogenase [Sphingomonas sp. Root1294]KQY72023.1 alcohol dehydrogenase [Sphingomonas sp. Root50]KRB94709.1 alcohol dehydrogenase [Sphingomonas sp. Root720]
MKFQAVSAAMLVAALASCAPHRSVDVDWPLHGLDAGENRFSTLGAINPFNVGQLGVAWYADFDARSLRGVEGTPLVVDGVMYASGPWSKVIALDARTGRKLWDYDPQVAGGIARRGCCDVVNRGVAYADGKVFVGVLDGRLVALDAKTGKPVWTVQTTDREQSYTITGAPRIVKDKVVIGNGGAEYGVRGYVTAYDVATGRQAWRFYTIPGDPKRGFENGAMAMAAKSWHGEWWKYGGGGTAWDSMSYDPELDLLYIGVGNGGPWDRTVRSPGGGDNLFLSSIVAVRPSTGEYVWHFQEVPGDEWDYTATQHMILADLEIDGKPRKVLMQAPKNGFFYILDRTDGTFISGTPYVPVTWAKGLDPKTGRPDIVPEARYSSTGKPFLGMPSPAGGHSWQPMSFNPKTGLVYLPTAEIPYGYVAGKAEDFRFDQRGWNTGQDPGKTAMPEDPAIRAQIRGMMRGALVAWDPKAGKRAWSVPMPLPWNGGVLSTTSGLVFQGTGTGDFAAYDASSGKRLWSMSMGSGIVAPPITYAIAGVQYVSVAVGWGGILPLNMGEALKASVKPRVNRVVTFRLGGTATLPLPPEAPEAPLAPPPSTASAAVIAQGRELYHVRCWMCHGDSVVNHGGVPDLRRSMAIADPDTFRAFVLEGAAEPLGMPNFSKDLKPGEVEAIRAYAIKRANDLKADPSMP